MNMHQKQHVVCGIANFFVIIMIFYVGDSVQCKVRSLQPHMQDALRQARNLNSFDSFLHIAKHSRKGNDRFVSWAKTYINTSNHVSIAVLSTYI
jgi:hypothetical protein